MNVFIAAFIMMALLGLIALLLVNNRKYKALANEKNRIAPFILSAVFVLMGLDVAGGSHTGEWLMLFLSLGILPMLPLTSSLLHFKDIKVVIAVVFASMVLFAVYRILVIGGLAPIPHGLTVLSSVFLGICNGGLLIWGIVRRIRNVKEVMKSGTVWSGVCLCVDMVYVFFSLSVPVVVLAVSYIDHLAVWQFLIGSVLLGAELIALGVRVSNDSVFVLCHRHERRIVESLKISHVEAVSDAVAENDQYKEVYERVVAYFEKEKPYLNGSLTINDLVKVVFSNKLYISRAISQYTGRNFCQFVNYHRISYSIKCFRENPELKIVELASMCGFNSVVSLNMAFRLFIGENPSDWCRKERNKMLRHIK